MLPTDVMTRDNFHAGLSHASSLMTLVALLGCTGMGLPAAAETARSADTSSARQMNLVIIKFRDPATDPSQPRYLSELSRAMGVTMVYVRPMSGGAHVLRVDGASGPEHFQRIVQALAQRPEVQYAEPDRHMYRMPHE